MATPTPTSVAPRVAVTRWEVLGVTVARTEPGLIPRSSSPPPNLTAEPQVWRSNTMEVQLCLTGLDLTHLHETELLLPVDQGRPAGGLVEVLEYEGGQRGRVVILR